MLDVLFSATLLLVLSAAVIPQALATADRSRGLGAVRYLAARMAMARAQAVSRSATVALRFDDSPRGITVGAYQDGNRNGVRSLDIELGIDRVVEPRVLLADLFPGVAIGIAPQTPAVAPVQIGGTNLFSFTPSGTASSGTIYVLGRDGTQWAVRVLGATGRSRTLRYSPQTGEWLHAF